jgi:hypothetical protein
VREPHAVEAVAALVGRRTVRSSFTLAAHEFEQLSAPVDWRRMRALDGGGGGAGRLAFVCAPDDIWFPPHHFAELRAQLPHAPAVWDETLGHAFCVSEAQCARVADHVAALLAGDGAAADAADVALDLGGIEKQPPPPAPPLRAAAKL